MKNLRKYGISPYSVAVVHGGPGAAGEMKAVARQLARNRGILEPLQTAASLEGQVKELKTVLAEHGRPPFSLVGFSWGAWLSFIVAARHPTLVKKLILICSGPFDEKYTEKIAETRWNRLDVEERQKARSLIRTLDNPTSGEKNRAFAQLGELLEKADTYDPIEEKTETLDCRYDIFENVWPQGTELRKSGRLLDLARRIQVPVVAIHGDFDPHPAEGVREPLSSTLKDFRFILLKNCGHRPWIERQAREKFFSILEKEL
jgi:pimeloyl-ACP methyl ester carboxylesterase